MRCPWSWNTSRKRLPRAGGLSSSGSLSIRAPIQRRRSSEPTSQVKTSPARRRDLDRVLVPVDAQVLKPGRAYRASSARARSAERRISSAAALPSSWMRRRIASNSSCGGGSSDAGRGGGGAGGGSGSVSTGAGGCTAAPRRSSRRPSRPPRSRPGRRRPHAPRRACGGARPRGRRPGQPALRASGEGVDHRADRGHGRRDETEFRDPFHVRHSLMTPRRRASRSPPLYSMGFSLRQAPLIPERRAHRGAARPREGDTGTDEPIRDHAAARRRACRGTPGRDPDAHPRARHPARRHLAGDDSWGRRKLAYEIDKKPEAFYYLLHFDCDAETLAELTRVLKITDGVLRHMAVRRLPAAATMPAREPSSGPPREHRERLAAPARPCRGRPGRRVG